MRRLLIGLLGAIAVLGIAAGPANAQDGDQGEEPGGAAPDVAPVDVLQVSGLVDDIVVDEIGAAIDRAEEEGSQALVLQVDSRGAVVGDDVMASLLDRIDTAPVPIGVWVGPTGARLYGTPAQILAVADVTGMAPGARVGNVGLPVSRDHELGPALTELRSRTVGLTDARALNVFKQRISDEGIATIVNMLDALDGYEEDGVVLDTTTEVVTDSGVVQRETIAVARFAKLGLVDQLFHTVASPPVTYLLLLIGLALLIFEFYTAGVGIAGVVGAACAFLACYGLAALPARWWAVALLVAAMLAFAVDVQVGIPRLWTGIGIVLTIVGSFWLFEPINGTSLRPSWISLIAGIGGVMLTFIVGMPSMTRTRFATPTVGREWMIGADGVAVSAIDPEGIVEVNDAQWRARTNRATPIGSGEALRVASIDGVTLEVEPLEGAAKDYREMRKKPDADDEVEPGQVDEPARTEPA
ncbi:MAG: NfeD family protein [Ilumatobacter sp.]|uniref:NfeD family protein n=1 Tax=Ilumatobacter sp. TaxID=1967498 RepID=UPI00262BE817|nr:NfeD family protein [Ilumatobacter sp.]MDJ0769429.1 NfeD family protein [Ilumatobacter sp.]